MATKPGTKRPAHPPIRPAGVQGEANKARGAEFQTLTEAQRWRYVWTTTGEAGRCGGEEKHLRMIKNADVMRFHSKMMELERDEEAQKKKAEAGAGPVAAPDEKTATLLALVDVLIAEYESGSRS